MGKYITITSHYHYQSLLETMQEQQVNLYYECREGYCGTCKLKLVAGDVRYRTEPTTPLAADECLPCCAYPFSDVTLELPK